MDDDSLTNGFMFRRLVHRRLEGDQRERHDPAAGLQATAVLDPFAAKPSLILFCDIIEPSTGQYYSRDPRATAKLAEAYLKSNRHRRYHRHRRRGRILHLRQRPLRHGRQFRQLYAIDSIEGPGSNLKDYPEGNMGHRPVVKGGYFPVAPRG